VSTKPPVLAGIVGWPIAHSLSPLLHNNWLQQGKISGFYVPLAVRREDFSEVIQALRHSGFVGVNVTVPHKEAAFAIADRCDRTSTLAGASNLLLFGKDCMEARNTDVAGLKASLREALGETSIKGRAAVLLGAGGAARAAVLALDAIGVGTIAILNRSPGRAAALASALGPSTRARLSAHSFSEWGTMGAATSLLVNATSAGMKGAGTLNLSLSRLPRTALVCDLVYNPLETALLRQARRRGLKAINGLSMLIHQAAPSFKALFGGAPKVTPAIRRYLEKALHEFS